jgi:hypothetical protein
MLLLGFAIALPIPIAYLAGKFPFFAKGVLFAIWVLALLPLVMMTTDTAMAGVAWLLGAGGSYAAYHMASSPPWLNPGNGMTVLDKLEADLNNHESISRAKTVDIRMCLTPRSERRARARNGALVERVRAANYAYEHALSDARYMCPDALLEHLKKPKATFIVTRARERAVGREQEVVTRTGRRLLED